MAKESQIRVTTDPSTGEFRLQPVDSLGQATTQYIPDLMTMPDQLTYVFDEPRVLQILIKSLSVSDTSGGARATRTLAMIRKMKLRIDGQDDHGEPQKYEKTPEDAVDDWASVIETMPTGHGVKEILLQFSSEYSMNESITDAVSPIGKALSIRAGRQVDVLCVQ